MKNSQFLVLPLIVILAFGTANAVQFEASNNATGTSGGTCFDQEIGVDYTEQVMSDSSSFIWNTFNQQPADRKDYAVVTLIVESLDLNNVVAYTSGNAIHYSESSISCSAGDVKIGFVGVVYHEMTHVWQWNGGGNAPSGLIEGIADFVRLKAGYVASNWVKPGKGDRWDQGYDVTAYFLDYCNGLKSDFVAQLNAKMKDGYSNDFFVQLLGKTVDQLWSDYKTMYGM